MRTQLLVISLILLLVSLGIECYPTETQEPSTVWTQAKDAVNSAWETVSGKTQELFQKARSIGVEEKVKEYYETSTGAVKPYVTVLYDQVYHWWHGN